jgi:Spy/CpxP family protein refolding chaperone
MKNWRRYIWLPLVFSLLGGIYACSHQPSISEQVDSETKNERPATMGGPMAARGMELIQNSPDLTGEQKEKLIGLSQRMMQEMGELRKEESQLKTVLFKTLVDPKSDDRKIEVIKNKIVKLDKKRTDKMLSALSEAQKILGRKSLADEKVYQTLMMERLDHL